MFSAQRLFGRKWDSGRTMLCFSLMLETQIHKLFCDACLAPSTPSTAQGKQNTSDRFCLIVKRVDRLHWAGCGYLLQARTSGFNRLHPFGRGWHATKGLDASNLFSVLGRVETFQSGTGNLSHKEGDRDKGKGQIYRERIEKKLEVKMKVV